MTDTDPPFRGNDKHFKILRKAISEGDISAWNRFARESGSAFRARLAGVNLADFDIREANLRNADFTGAVLSRCRLTRADLSGARLKGARLDGADLTGARLVRADLSSADLSGAVLTNIRARGADFSSADLSGATLDGAQLDEADLSGAAVTGTSRSGTRITAKIKVRRKTTGGDEPELRSIQRAVEKPYVTASRDEQEMREVRIKKEAEQEIREQTRLERKLGKRRPLFRRADK